MCHIIWVFLSLPFSILLLPLQFFDAGSGWVQKMMIYVYLSACIYLCNTSQQRHNEKTGSGWKTKHISLENNEKKNALFENENFFVDEMFWRMCNQLVDWFCWHHKKHNFVSNKVWLINWFLVVTNTLRWENGFRSDTLSTIFTLQSCAMPCSIAPKNQIPGS